MGDRSVAEELSALRKLLSMLEKSLSELIESAEEAFELDSADVFLISGALSACTFVVNRSSVGSEIFARLIVPGVYLTVHDLGSAESSPRVCARARRVKFRTKDMVNVYRCWLRT